MAKITKKTSSNIVSNTIKTLKMATLKKNLKKKKKRLNKILIPNETGVRRQISRYRMKRYIRNI